MRAILTYHSIDSSGSPISIPEPVFRRHVQWLADQGPAVVTVAELLALTDTESAVAITFDDAFVNFADVAWPLLRERGLPVTLYVPTGHVGRTNEWGGVTDPAIPALPIMDWDTLGRLKSEGVHVGSHTCSHPHLERLPAGALREELEQSAMQLMDRLGARPAGLAYPYGSCDPRVATAAAEVYDHACTTELRLLDASDTPHLLPRLDAYYLQSAGTLESWGSTRMRMYVRARAGARRCRQLLTVAVGR